MGDRVFCGACGAELNGDAKFCTSCGARQDEFEQPAAQGVGAAPGVESATAGAETTAPLPPPEVAPAAGTAPRGQQHPPAAAAGGAEPPPQARISDRIENVSPGAGEFAGQLAAQLSTPGVAVALITAGVAAGACLVAGLVLAVALPDTSVLAFERWFGSDPGALTEAFGQFLSLLLVSFALPGVGPAHLGATLFLAVPIGAAAVAASMQAERTRGLSTWARLAWPAGAGVPFAVAVVVAAVVASDLDPAVGGAILLGVLWVGLGGVLGTALALRREGVSLLALLPANALPPLRTAATGLRPLALAAALATVIGVSVAFVQTVRYESSVSDSGSTVTALVDYALLSADVGVNYTALGAGVEFRDDFPVPIPVDDPSEVLGDLDGDGVLVAQTAPTPVETGDFGADDGGYRLFDFGSAMAPYTFVPLLLVLIGVVGLSALYAGFGVARAAGARTPAASAGFGALVGPLWSSVAVLANAIHLKWTGAPDGDSMFVMFLLGGAALGALGGLLSSNSATQPAAEQPVQAR